MIIDSSNYDKGTGNFIGRVYDLDSELDMMSFFIDFITDTKHASYIMSMSLRPLLDSAIKDLEAKGYKVVTELSDFNKCIHEKQPAFFDTARAHNSTNDQNMKDLDDDHLLMFLIDYPDLEQANRLDNKSLYPFLDTLNIYPETGMRYAVVTDKKLPAYIVDNCGFIDAHDKLFENFVNGVN